MRNKHKLRLPSRFYALRERKELRKRFSIYQKKYDTAELN